MVQLFSISVVYKDLDEVVILKSAHDLQQFGFFQRRSVSEFMDFTTTIIAERCEISTRHSVEEDGEYME